MRVAILYYSVTGNTQHVAELIGQGIRAAQPDAIVDLHDATVTDPEHAFAASPPDVWGFGSLAWGGRIATLVVNLSRRIPGPLLAGKPFFVFCCCAGDASAACAKMGKELAARGGLSVGSTVIRGPPNWLPSAGPHDDHSLWGSDEWQRAIEFGRSLPPLIARANTTHKHVVRLGSTAGWEMSDQVIRDAVGPIHFDDAVCTRCGKCVEGCPYHALQLPADGGVPVWDAGRCMGCLHCIHHCPSSACNSQVTEGKTRYVFEPAVCIEGYGRTVNDAEWEALRQRSAAAAAAAH